MSDKKLRRSPNGDYLLARSALMVQLWTKVRIRFIAVSHVSRLTLSKNGESRREIKRPGAAIRSVAWLPSGDGAFLGVFRVKTER